jgi:selenium metabolism protein YedF
MLKVNAIGDTCPIPVVKTKNAIKELNGPGQVEVLVDNEIAVQNLTKMAQQKGYKISSEKLEDNTYKVIFTIENNNKENNDNNTDNTSNITEDEAVTCQPDKRANTVVQITSSTMGTGNDELGAVLIKGFIYALSQQDTLPQTILFYNGGAKLTCEDSPALEDLKSMEAQGVEILTCGTCLDFYGLKDKLQVGSVTNMYVIVEKLQAAGKVIRP